MTAEPTLPTVGTPAPKFTLKNQDGASVSLADFKGKHVVLYFYPKDDTPGCTVEAQAFRDALGDLESLGAVVLGVSPDSEASHEKFCKKYDLNFELLADADHATAESYGVWVEKHNYGKTYMGIQRATFLIDPKGKVAHVWPKVKPEGHAAEVLGVLRGVGG